MWKRLETVSFTVFVDNLPMSMTKSWLWQIFQHEGKVIDIFMSRKKRRTNNKPFAFVRFALLKEAQAAVKNIHRIDIRGCRITVSMAEYKRCNRQGSEPTWRMKGAHQITNTRGEREAGRDGRSYRDVVAQKGEKKHEGEKEETDNEKKVQNDQEETKYEKTRVVYGEDDKSLLEELERSLIRETLAPTDLELVDMELRQLFWCMNYIRAMGSYKTLITFSSKAEMEDVLKERRDVLQRYFEEIRPWTIVEVSQTRRTWVECFGLPL